MEPEKIQNTVNQDTFPSAPNEQKSNLSMLMGVIGFLVVLVGLGWYMLNGGGMVPAVAEPTGAVSATQQATATTAASPSFDTAAAALSTQGTSDDPKAIQADLTATDLNSLGDINKI